MALILFDIDGTILRGNGVGMKGLGRAFQEATGHPMPSNISAAGRTDPTIVREGFRLLGLVGERWLEWERRIWELYPAYLEEELATPDPGRRLLCGIEALLGDLQRRQRPLGLITGNLEITARMKLEPFQLNSYFPIGAFGSDCADRNRLGFIALERARRHFGRDFEPEQTWIIGDTERDIAAARALGARVLAVGTGPKSAAELQEFLPDAALDDLKATQDLLQLLDLEQEL